MPRLSDTLSRRKMSCRFRFALDNALHYRLDYALHHTLDTLHYTLDHTLHYTLDTLRYTLDYTLHYTLYTLHYTLDILHFTQGTLATEYGPSQQETPFSVPLWGENCVSICTKRGAQGPKNANKLKGLYCAKENVCKLLQKSKDISFVLSVCLIACLFSCLPVLFFASFFFCLSVCLLAPEEDFCLFVFLVEIGCLLKFCCIGEYISLDLF